MNICHFYYCRIDSDSDEEIQRKRKIDESIEAVSEGMLEYRACIRGWSAMKKIDMNKYKKQIEDEMEAKRRQPSKKAKNWNIPGINS